MKRTIRLMMGSATALPLLTLAAPLPYVVVDTGQERCYDAETEIAYPASGAAYGGQDAQHQGVQPAYRKNGDGTVSDLNTGLMWVQNPGAKKTYAQAAADAPQCRVGGHADWRLPTVKELYSLILFSGIDPDPQSRDTRGLTPFIDTRAFAFQYGKAEDGDRIIDSQFATCTLYVSTTMGGNKTMFGVNFADGRIKGYPIDALHGHEAKKFNVLYVRGNPAYGKNDFVDNGDGTVTDRATGLMWEQGDSGRGMDWKDALAYAEKLTLAGHDDWRLPNAKELQSIVDYTRSPDTTRSAAISPVFKATPFVNEGGKTDYAYYWTGTTHVNPRTDAMAVYIAFGRALGFMSFPPGRSGGSKTLMDVHGAGAQRCDVKEGDPAQLPQGQGPQGDVMRILNLVRGVRGGAVTTRKSGPAVQASADGRRGGPGMGRPSFVQRLDRDGDGKVSPQEFDGPADQFPILDKNGDGYLSEDEAPSRPPSGGRGLRR